MKAWLSFLGRAAGRLAGQGLDLVCPPRCVFCRADVSEPGNGPAVVCDDCARRLGSDGPRCPACGAPGSSAGDCRHCRGRCRDWDGIVVLAAYADDVRSAVLAAKRPGGEILAAGLATLLAGKHATRIAAWRIDLIVPVPMHWTRRMLRGASAADGLARGVSAALGVPRRAALERTRATRMQNELEPAARRANVLAAFRATAAVAGRRVLVVDDVTTTGGTLAACRQALVAAGAAAVYAAAVARADAAEPPAS
ncbi:MAG: ComF family protein [Planctomycetota bacterium]